MPFDDRKKWVKQLHELNTREARRTHPGAESTDPPPAPPRAPPPPDLSFPPRPIEVERASNPVVTKSDPLPKVERHARWWKALAAIVAGITALGTGMCGAAEWTLSKAKVALDERVDQRCAPIAASAVASAIAPPRSPSHDQRLKALEKEAKKNGGRWDDLNDLLQQKFNKPNQPKVRKFGPAAEAHGATPPEADE